MRQRAVLALLALCSLAMGVAVAQPPTLYSQPTYQSPVRAAPDDLLLLPGDGLSPHDTVVYAAYTTRPPSPPDAVPTQSTSTTGVARIVSASGAPHSLTVHMPEVATPGRPYALWVRNSGGEWSNRVVINDPRPLWISPSFVYATTAIGSLPRRLKVVGRNLRPTDGTPRRLRLAGPQTVELEQTSDDAAPAIDEYVLTFALPKRLEPGEYAVQLETANGEWSPVANQSLRVDADPATPKEYQLSAAEFGACRPDDERDDSGCLGRAIATARADGGGIVRLGAGRWDLGQAVRPNTDPIVVPRGVGLVGAKARIVRRAHPAKPAPAFVLMGENRVSGLTFSESQPYRAGEPASAMLQLGPDWQRASAGNESVEMIVIADNVFDRTGYAVRDGGHPLRRIFIVGNRIGAHHTGLSLGGSRFNVAQRFRLDDSVIAHNTFIPGSYLDVHAGQGAMASELGASSRVDFSHNVADGASVDALYPDAAPGWRAGFFWHMNDSTELLLVSRNRATCTGDKAGDGEAIAYDNNANTFAFSGASKVVRATANSITLAGTLKGQQSRRSVDSAQYYRGHWLRILQGAGVGQVRRIESYTAAADGQSVTFQIAPAWDVTPRDASASVGREFWQVTTVGNVIDHRKPLCRKSNRSQVRGGGFALWGQMSDSVLALNRQYDTDGIVLHQGYRPDAPGCKDCTGWVNGKSFIDIRDNLIEGEYDWTSDCSWSGIQAHYAAAPDVVPPTVTFGLSISYNEIVRADGLRGGAISMPRTWHAGPPPHRWQLIDSTLIHHNAIRDVNGGAARTKCERMPSDRVGINLAGSDLVWRTVTYRNSCTSTPIGYRAGGYETLNWSPRRDSETCESATDPR